MPPSVLGVDVGGTFTDLVLLRDGQMTLHKLTSTPADPAQAVLQGISELTVDRDVAIVHGSTVATNALLEHRGARTALVATEGFEDVLEIGRQHRPSLYDLLQDKPSPLVPEGLRFGLAERVDHAGRVVRALHPAEVRRMAAQVAASGVEAVAVSLLFSFLNPEHEQAVKEALETLSDPPFISVSSEVLPEYREYERTATVTVNAYVGPVVSRYVRHLRKALGRPFRIMQSSGGSISAEVAASQPVRTVLSGPAGGVVGAFHVASTAGHPHIITLDMGGTSTDVSLCPGLIQQTTSVSLGGLPVAVPMTDIHTVGAGGGSIARVDEGGALVVGPQSAGADPGPTCYGRGTDITVTDANLLLGRLDAQRFLGGRMALDVARAQALFEPLAQTLRTTPQEAAQGIVRVVNSNMERALRAISLERGFDPRQFTLVPFGGAGPMHACELAASLDMPRILVPPAPGVLSALGVAMADIVKDYSRTVLLGPAELEHATLEAAFRELEEQARFELLQEGLEESQIELHRLLDLRYVGQSYELTVPYPQGMELLQVLEGFHEAHHQRYGHADARKPVELVNVRLRGVGRVPKPELRPQPDAGPDASPALLERRPVVFEGGPLDTPVYDRARLGPGNRLQGPALVLQMDATTVVPPGWRGEVDGWGNLVLEQSIA